MRILVTGASGHLGGKLARHLAQAGHEVTGLDLVACTTPPIVHKADLTLLDADLRRHFEGQDVVVHLAADRSPAAGWTTVVPHNMDAVLMPWLIRQVALGGTARLSASGGHSGHAVFGQAPRAALIPVDGFWQVPIGPTGFFKTSYARADVGQDGLSYSVAGSRGATVVTFRPHLSDAAHYTETLPQDPAGPGQAAALFCDDGTFGAYGELELYGHRSSPDTGAMIVDAHILHGEANAVAAAQAAQATEISSIPIS